MKRTQVEKSERSRALILEAALRLFSRQGYRGTSIREIAEAAGLSTGNVYHHFPDKEALFRTLLDQYWTAIASPDFPFNKALAQGCFPDDLEALGRAAEESVRAHRGHIALIYVDVVEFDGSHIRKFYSEMADRFAAFLAQRDPGGRLGARLRPGTDPTAALMLASRIFLHYFAVEVLFGVPDQFGRPTAQAVKEISEILRWGALAPPVQGESGRKAP
ncbi:MAG: TetR/AcrR family transcriptional regulator [Acidobacteria bacterium]|nr:TetR/AcrR family transcriptional regulator [Acidobacteriota bacterium]